MATTETTVADLRSEIAARTSEPEEELAGQLRISGLPLPFRQWKFATTRRYKFDFAWPARMTALEVNGGVHSGGRHVRGAGYTADLERLNFAIWSGWKVYQVTPEMVRDGRALALVTRVLSELAATE